MPNFQLFCGDSLDQLKNLPDNSVDSIVCDPPYGLAFMGKKWDHSVPSVDIWKECLRVLKPGGHLLAFAGTRTQHRMAVNIEDAGFEIRDMLAWVYASGFPKSHNIANDIDKMKGQPARGKAIPTASTHLPSGKYAEEKLTGNRVEKYEARTEDGKPWAGWGTALKPALEPITLARKPVDQKTVALNVLTWGTGGINIDACRVGDFANTTPSGINRWNQGYLQDGATRQIVEATFTQSTGRFPANFIHDGSEEVVSSFPNTPPTSQHARPNRKKSREGTVSVLTSMGELPGKPTDGHKDEGGSAARFFYCAKASKQDREEGLTGSGGSIGAKGNGLGRVCETCQAPQLKPELCSCETKSWVNPTRKNNHPTVKPTDLMRYLCRLITPPGGTVLDPFMGSGSTDKAAMLEGFDFIGVDLSQEYVEISRARIEHARNQAEEKVRAELSEKQKPRLF